MSLHSSCDVSNSSCGCSLPSIQIYGMQSSSQSLRTGWFQDRNVARKALPLADSRPLPFRSVPYVFGGTDVCVLILITLCPFGRQHVVPYSMASHCTCHKDVVLNLMMKHVMPVQITTMLSALSFFSCLCRSKSRMSIYSSRPVKAHGCPDKDSKVHRPASAVLDFSQ